MAAATFYTKEPDNPGTIRLRDGSFVFNAKLEDILLARKTFSTLTKTNNYVRSLSSTVTAFQLLNAWKEKPSEPKTSSVSTTSKKNSLQIQIIIAWIP